MNAGCRTRSAMMRALLVGLALASTTLHGAAGTAPAAAPAAEPAAQDAAAAPPAKPLTHRPLRTNVQAGIPDPTTPVPFTGYANVPPFSVVPRKDQLTFFPCTGCHAQMTPNPQPRQLNTPHPAALVHGNGRIWCLDCHTLKDRDVLHTLAGAKVDFDESHLVCGQCHFPRHKDWYFGGHGKRVENWNGPREIYNCTHCHDPHSPTVKPREPSKPPPVRAQLQPMKPLVHATQKVWERHANPQQEAHK